MLNKVEEEASSSSCTSNRKVPRKRIIIKTPLCPNTCCPKVPWLKLSLILSLVTVYHYGKVKTKVQNREDTDFTSLAFLVITSTWLSVINLEPKWLRCSRTLKSLYDILAVTLLANLLLDTLWAQVKIFMSTMTAMVYQDLEDSFLADYLYDWIEAEDFEACLAEVGVIIYGFWVANSFCLLNPIKTIFCHIYCSLKK